MITLRLAPAHAFGLALRRMVEWLKQPPEAIRPCRCGSESVSWHAGYDQQWIECQDCGASTGVCGDYAEAVERWSAR